MLSAPRRAFGPETDLFCAERQRDILAMLLPLANTLTTFVLHWDRTSVPFDRIPLDDADDAWVESGWGLYC